MATISTYKDLVVWQKSMLLVTQVYAESAPLPQHEIYGLTSQLRRAAVSIPSNIAEGSRRGGTKDLVQFLRIADGSAGELETQLLLAEQLYSNVSFSASKALLLEVQKMLGALIGKLKQT